MNSIITYFSSQGLDFWHILTVCGILLIGTLIISLLGRLVFGKNSLLNCAISSAIGIFFIYTLEIVFHAFPNPLANYIPPLPFATISGDHLSLFAFQNAEYTVICYEILSMMILAFIMSLIDRLVPKGENIFTWLFFRIVTIICTILFHNIILGLFQRFMPQGIIQYAPVILLSILGVLLLTGLLKFIIGALMATVNPVIGVFYTFFFANMIGKQITRSVLTTGILAGFVILLQKFGIVTVSIAPAALFAYIPFAIALIAMWRIVHDNT